MAGKRFEQAKPVQTKTPDKIDDLSATLYGIEGSPTAAVLIEARVKKGRITHLAKHQPDVLSVVQKRASDLVAQGCRGARAERAGGTSTEATKIETKTLVGSLTGRQ